MVITSLDGTFQLEIDDDDIPFEEEVIRYSYNVPSWVRYIDHKLLKKSSFVSIFSIYERALKQLPGSFKLWNSYLKLRRHFVRERCITDIAFELANEAHERALIFMNKMPRIWIEYCKFMSFQRYVTRTRRLFDRALRALPITQHARLWPLYIEFLKLHNIPQTGLTVFRRYMKLQPENIEDYINYLVKYEFVDEAVQCLISIVNRDDFVSKNGKSHQQLYYDLCELICKNPDKVKSVHVGEIIRNGLVNFTDGVGELWCLLGDYYIRIGLFEKARDVYEEGMISVLTVKDFGQVFDSYAQFIDAEICLKIQDVETHKTEEAEMDLELLMERYEDLMDRRALLLNSVLLRQNKHNVNEWLKRIQLLDGKPSREIIKTFTEAIQQIDAKFAVGHPNVIWSEFAKFYENNNQIYDARKVFEKGVLWNFKTPDDLANLWCDYAEMELRHKNYKEALRILRTATSVPSNKMSRHNEKDSAQKKVYRSIKLWSFHVDLEESLGTFETTKSAYTKMISLKVATPQIILNFAKYMEVNNYFEESFKVYEQGVNLFKWPHLNEIWSSYLTKFVDRYENTKLERLRDLFEQCLNNIPAKFAFNYHIYYAMIEEKYGLGRRAISIYDRLTQNVLPENALSAFSIYIRRVSTMYGITQTREIFEKSLESLKDDDARMLGMEYAKTETKLGEIDRARAIYSYLSQISNPATNDNFWKTWHEFEVSHGNEETFREMRRIKRTIENRFTIQPSYSTSHMISVMEDAANSSNQPMEALEKAAEAKLQATLPINKTIAFVRSSKPEETTSEPPPTEVEETANDVNIAEKPVPKEVFGGFQKAVPE